MVFMGGGGTGLCGLGVVFMASIGELDEGKGGMMMGEGGGGGWPMRARCGVHGLHGEKERSRGEVERSV